MAVDDDGVVHRPSGHPRGHTKFTTTVTKKAGALVVTTPNGATHQLNANMAWRHGQEPFKAGEEVVGTHP